ncbi:hypothetical protein ACFPM0_35750 [Pseudonocardia sulfidoxydans]|uniref:hypothetical protein n=1 Tax=Pseudonocardia sulfidoxydans TaxID=54011 RepID=UPI00360EDA12
MPSDASPNRIPRSTTFLLEKAPGPLAVRRVFDVHTTRALTTAIAAIPKDVSPPGMLLPVPEQPIGLVGAPFSGGLVTVGLRRTPFGLPVRAIGRMRGAARPARANPQVVAGSAATCQVGVGAGIARSVLPSTVGPPRRTAGRWSP